MRGTQTITLEILYNKLAAVEKKVTEIEHVVLPEIELSAKEKAGLLAIRREIGRGSAVSFRDYLKK